MSESCTQPAQLGDHTALFTGLEKHIQFTLFLHISMTNISSDIFLSENENNIYHTPKLLLITTFLIKETEFISHKTSIKK